MYFFWWCFYCFKKTLKKLSENSAKGIDFYTQWVYNKDTIKERETERKDNEK